MLYTGRRAVRALGSQVVVWRPPQQASVLAVVQGGQAWRAQGQHVCRDCSHADLGPRGLCVQAEGGVFHSLMSAQGPGVRPNLLLPFRSVGIGHCQ